MRALAAPRALSHSRLYNPISFLIFRNLDETTRSIYKENVRLTEALNFHKKEGDMFRKEVS